MTRVLLDIGAEGVAFARRFIFANQRQNLILLCGNMRFKGVWNGEDMGSGSIRKIHAWYDSFNVPDTSLDVVTMNSFNPGSGTPQGISRELYRALKPGGIFFSAHQAGLHPNLDKDLFVPITFREPNSGGRNPLFLFGESISDHNLWKCASLLKLPSGLEIVYPAAPAIVDRIVYLRLKQLKLQVAFDGSIYRFSSAPPSLRIWMRL